MRLAAAFAAMMLWASTATALPPQVGAAGGAATCPANQSPVGSTCVPTITPTPHTNPLTSTSVVILQDGTTATAGEVVTAGSLPGAPTSLVAGTATSTAVPLTWIAPSTGLAPTGYSVCATPSGGSQSCTSTGSVAVSYAVTGLTPSTLYALTVAAVNGFGPGPASSSVNATTANGGGSTRYVVTGGFGPPPTSGSFGSNGYIGASGQINITNSGGAVPSSAYATWTRSTTVVPTAGTGATQYSTRTNEYAVGAAYGGNYPALWTFSNLALWPKGSPTTGVYYLWIYWTDGTGSGWSGPMLDTYGNPLALNASN